MGDLIEGKLPDFVVLNLRNMMFVFRKSPWENTMMDMLKVSAIITGFSWAGPAQAIHHGCLRPNLVGYCSDYGGMTLGVSFGDALFGLIALVLVAKIIRFIRNW